MVKLALIVNKSEIFAKNDIIFLKIISYEFFEILHFIKKVMTAF